MHTVRFCFVRRVHNDVSPPKSKPRTFMSSPCQQPFLSSHARGRWARQLAINSACTPEASSCASPQSTMRRFSSPEGRARGEEPAQQPSVRSAHFEQLANLFVHNSGLPTSMREPLELLETAESSSSVHSRTRDHRLALPLTLSLSHDPSGEEALRALADGAAGCERWRSICSRLGTCRGVASSAALDLCVPHHAPQLIFAAGSPQAATRTFAS